MPSTQKTVSVIMPTYNRVHTIEQAIQSVQSQSFKDWKLLVIDDGSTDATAEIVQVISASDQRIQYERLKSNAGVSVARNRGISLAQGEYIAYLDSDNHMYHDWLECMIDYFDRHPSVSWLYPRLNTSMIDRKSEDERVVLTESIVPLAREVSIEDFWSMDFQADPNGLVHKRTLATEKSITWDEQIQSYGDYDYALQLSRHFPDGFAVHPFVLGRYIRTYGINGMCSNRGYKEIISGLTYLQHKYGDFTTWTNLNGVDERIARYNECLKKGMRPIDGLREKYGVEA